MDAKASPADVTPIRDSIALPLPPPPAPALSRRADQGYRAFVDEGAKVLVLTSRKPGPAAGWKMHVSLCLELPAGNLQSTLDAYPGATFGISMTEPVAQALERRFPGLAVPESARGVFQYYDMPDQKVSLLLGREWEVRVASKLLLGCRSETSNKQFQY